MTNLLGSSLESNSSDPGPSLPTHIPFENREQPSKLSDLAKMMYAVQPQFIKNTTDLDDSDAESNDDELPLTSEDSENLISDEEDDKESGFLSQF